ncbi:MAG TPA: hypothetical protein VNV66_15125 [Pilimelia sp.]|nr:hypothetical protein [Pilimelia sp.]
MDPSPTVHTARVGRAVTVADSPGTDAVADCGSHPPVIANQVGRFTNVVPAGFTRTCTEGKVMRSRARWANCSGVTTGGDGSRTSSLVLTPFAEQTFQYQAPGPSGWPPTPPTVPSVGLTIS